MAPIIIGRGSERDPASLTLYTTANRNRIENERPEEDRPIEALRAARKIVRGISPTATCRSLTAMYNCAGMVFASRRTFIDSKHIVMILRDDEFRETSEADAMEGDLVTYSRGIVIEHIGVIYRKVDESVAQDKSRVETWVLSQWGEDGEYLHKLREVHPIYGGDLKFWTERRPER